MFSNLDDSNYNLLAAKAYSCPGCASEQEFLQDLARIKSIARLFGKYSKTGDLNERLVLNHIIVLYNVFDHQMLTRMLVFKLGDYLHYLKPFLVLIGYWPERIVGIDGTDIIGTEVSMDSVIIEKLRKI